MRWLNFFIISFLFLMLALSALVMILPFDFTSQLIALGLLTPVVWVATLTYIVKDNHPKKTAKWMGIASLICLIVILLSPTPF